MLFLSGTIFIFMIRFVFFDIWEGGLAIHGGIIAGVLFGIYYFRKHRCDGLRIADEDFSQRIACTGDRTLGKLYESGGLWWYCRCFLF